MHREPSRASEPVHVLHVEDDSEWSLLVCRWLTKRGLKVLQLSCRAELLSYLSHCKRLPLCLLLDLTLPDGDGFEICTEIKSSPALQHLPIVIFSGRSVSSTECLEHSALYHVAKGVGAEIELSAALKAVLDQVERSRGVVDVGDLRLDPKDGRVLLAGETLAQLNPGPFAALLRLVRASPHAVQDWDLRESFLERHSYKKRDPELAVRLTVRTYISSLRRELGAVVGARLVRLGEDGYAYLPAPPA
jgi:DNA-binding response OmpR family regulator